MDAFGALFLKNNKRTAIMDFAPITARAKQVDLEVESGEDASCKLEKR